MFEFNGLSDKKSELLARFLIEPKNQSQIEYDEDLTATQRNIVAGIEESIGHYKIYNGGPEIQNMTKRV